jgi:hypothetical protein
MAVYEDIEDTGVNQYAKGNPIRGGLCITCGVVWNAFSLGSLEKNSALVEKYKGNEINDAQFRNAIAINTTKAGAQLAITATGIGATANGIGGGVMLIGGSTVAANSAIEVAANRDMSRNLGQPYTRTIAQDTAYVVNNGLVGAVFCGSAHQVAYYATRFAQWTSCLKLPAPAQAPEIALFRGTSRAADGSVYPGNPGIQRIGVTPTSTDPVVATVFATESENYGAGRLIIATGDDLAGVSVGPGNVRSGLELEVGVHLQPTEFAARAGIEVPASRARQALQQLGVEVPSRVPDINAADAFLQAPGSPRLTPQQIQRFIQLLRE